MAVKVTPAMRRRVLKRQRAQAKAKKKPKLGPLYQPAQQLSGRALQKAATGITNLEYSPQERALKQGLANVTTQGTALAGRAAGYYKDIAESEARRYANLQALGGELKTATSTQAGNTAAAFADMTKAEQARANSPDVLSELAALRARQDNASAAASDKAGAQASNWEGYMQALSGARTMRGGEVQDRLLTRLANEQAQIRDKQETLSVQRGNAMTKNLLGLRQQSFENALTQEELGVKKEDLAATMANIRADNASARDRLDLDARKFDADQAYKQAQIDIKRGIDPVTGKKLPKGGQSSTARLNKLKADFLAKHGYLPPTGNPKGKKNKGQEPAQSVKYRQGIDAGRSKWRTLMRKNNNNERIVKQKMLAGGYPVGMYNAIYDLERTGTLNPRNAAALRALGVRVPKAWKR